MYYGSSICCHQTLLWKILTFSSPRKVHVQMKDIVVMVPIQWAGHQSDLDFYRSDGCRSKVMVSERSQLA